mmetsp:Transcript_22165/g.47669  ORF Transcript_22165/g.47669 Transcript_22165/m.47669 type:complete len:604 (+) Transcript_22165:298-2109(+)
MGMDFASLVGSSAYLAKQLELRWFYHWEPAASCATDDANDDAERGSARSGRQSSDRSEGRLVRKRFHSMPFLRRNAIGRGGGTVGARRRTARGKGANKPKNDVIRLPKHGSMATNEAPKKKNAKRKRAGDGQNFDSNKKRARGKNATPTSTANPQPDESKKPSSSSASFSPYFRSPTARRKVLQKIPVELHHDETLVSERMKEAWLGGGNGGQSDLGNLGGSGDGASRFDNAANKEGQAKALVNTSSRSENKHHITNGGRTNSTTILPSTVALPSLLGTGDSRLGSTAPRQNQPPQPPAYFHYLYMQPNNVPATFVEEIYGRVCPFCDFDGKSDEGLLEHCARYHGMSVGTNVSPDALEGADCSSFEAALGEEGQLHVVVRGIPIDSTPPSSTTRIRENFAFVAQRLRNGARKSTGPEKTSTPFLQRPHHKTVSLDSAARSKKLLALQASDAPAPVISAYLPSDAVPVRQYFHARTSLPMSRGEWDEDSDGGADDAWLHEMGSELLDEFEDVSDREKTFMKSWNRFIKKNHVVADRDIGGMCHEFVSGHRELLREGDLRLNLLLHLFNLWDSGVISSSRILSSMAIFDGAETGPTRAEMTGGG